MCWFMKTTKGPSVLFFKNRYATNLSASLIKDNESVGSSRNRIMQLLYTCTRAIASDMWFSTGLKCINKETKNGGK